MNAMLTLTVIIPVSAASDNRKGYRRRGIGLPSFVMDLLFRCQENYYLPSIHLLVLLPGFVLWETGKIPSVQEG